MVEIKTVNCPGESSEMTSLGTEGDSRPELSQ